VLLNLESPFLCKKLAASLKNRRHPSEFKRTATQSIKDLEGSRILNIKIEKDSAASSDEYQKIQDALKIMRREYLGRIWQLSQKLTGKRR
jgi:hypothetical protein